MAICVGPPIAGYCPIVPAAFEQSNRQLALMKRLAVPRFELRDCDLRDFRQFVRAEVRKMFSGMQLHPGNWRYDPAQFVLTHSQWDERKRRDLLRDMSARLHVKTYPGQTLNQMAEQLRGMDFSVLLDSKPRKRRMGLFVKHEGYPSFKYPRNIANPPDFYKYVGGPLFDEIAHRIFSTVEWSMKRIPVPERPKYLMEYFGGTEEAESFGTYLSTDHTSFEAHFTGPFQRACEMQLYSFFSKLDPFASRLFHQINQWHTKTHTVEYRGQHRAVDLRASLEPVRMSGDMCTSLGNTFSNLMIMRYVCKKNGLCCKGVFEGDDSLTKVWSPTGQKVHLSKENFEMLGMDIKIIESDCPGKAGFCSQYFARDTDCVTDPKEILVRTPWSLSALATKQSNWKGLLKAKAVSLLCEFPAAPIVSSFASCLLRLAGDASPIFDWKLDWWKLHQLKPSIATACACPIRPASRLLCAELFGWSVEEQVALEHYFDQAGQGIPCFTHPILDHHLAGSDYSTMWRRFTIQGPLSLSLARQRKPWYCV